MQLRLSRATVLETAAPFIGFIAAMILLILMVAMVGESPGNALNAIYRISFSSANRFATVVAAAIPLFLAGLAVSVAFQGGVFNIGVEGQYFIGGLVGAIAGTYLRLPAIIHIPVVVIFSMIGGAAWAAIPAVLKVKRGISEVITTIMFNAIALSLVNYLVNGPLSGLQPGENKAPQLPDLQETAIFGRLNGFFRAIGWNVADHVYLDYSLIVALVFGIAIFLLIYRNRYGFEVRSIGTALDVSRYSGMRVPNIQLSTFLLSGGLAGLVGLQEVFAIRQHYTFEIAAGIGFDGIAVALIGRNNPIGVAFAALLFSFLKTSGYGMQLYMSVPNSIAAVTSGIMILIIVVSNELLSGYVRKLRKQEAA